METQPTSRQARREARPYEGPFHVPNVVDAVTAYTDLRCGYPEAPRLAWRAVCRRCEFSVKRMAVEELIEELRRRRQPADTNPPKPPTYRKIPDDSHAVLGRDSELPPWVAAALFLRDLGFDKVRAISLSYAFPYKGIEYRDPVQSPAASVVVNMLRRPDTYLRNVTSVSLQEVDATVDVPLLVPALAASPRAAMLRELALKVPAGSLGQHVDLGSYLAAFPALEGLWLLGGPRVDLTPMMLRGLSRMSRLRHIMVDCMDSGRAGTELPRVEDAARLGTVLATRLPHLTHVSIALKPRLAANVDVDIVTAIGRPFATEYFDAPHAAPLEHFDVAFARSLPLGCSALVSELLVRHPKLTKGRCGTVAPELSRLVAANVPVLSLAAEESVLLAIDHTAATASQLRRFVTEIAPRITSLQIEEFEGTVHPGVGELVKAALDDADVAPQLRRVEVECENVPPAHQVAVVSSLAGPRWQQLGCTTPDTPPNAAYGRQVLRCENLTRMCGFSTWPHVSAALAEEMELRRQRGDSQGDGHAPFLALEALDAYLPRDEQNGTAPKRLPVPTHWRTVAATLQGVAADASFRALAINTHSPSEQEEPEVIAAFEDALRKVGRGLQHMSVAVVHGGVASAGLGDAITAAAKQWSPQLSHVQRRYRYRDVGDADAFDHLSFATPPQPLMWRMPPLRESVSSEGERE